LASHPNLKRRNNRQACCGEKQVTHIIGPITIIGKTHYNIVRSSKHCNSQSHKTAFPFHTISWLLFGFRVAGMQAPYENPSHTVTEDPPLGSRAPLSHTSRTSNMCPIPTFYVYVGKSIEGKEGRTMWRGEPLS